VSLWEAVLPGELLKLPDELARVDGLLDDPVFFAPGSRHGQVTCVASCALRKLR
jgi:hypothetical protein